MVRYARRYRRRYARRYRKRSTLSTSRILTRKSATSQAFQIRALNRKVNRVMKQCKPEVKVNIGNAIDTHFTNSWTDSVDQQFTAPYITVGSNDDQRVGGKIRRQDIYKLSFDYLQVEAGDTRTAGDSGGVRVILLRFKNSVPVNTTLYLQYVLRDYTSSLLQSNYYNIQNYPLARNIGGDFYVDCDRLITLTKQNCRKQIKVKTPFYTCTYDDDENQSSCNHSLLVLISFGLIADSSVAKDIRVSGYRKTVFTDA